VRVLAPAGWVQLDYVDYFSSFVTGAANLYEKHYNPRIGMAVYRATMRRGILSQVGANRRQRRHLLTGRRARRLLVPYQQHLDRSLRQYAGKPCKERGCHGWQKIDDDRHSL
jgi:hypothetical protein